MASDAATAVGRRLRPGVRGEQGAEPPAEVGPVRFRDPEQLADHRERQRERVARHQVDGLVPPRAARPSSRSCHDRADPVLQPVDPPPGERRASPAAAAGCGRAGRRRACAGPARARAGPRRRPRRCGPARRACPWTAAGRSAPPWPRRGRRPATPGARRPAAPRAPGRRRAPARTAGTGRRGRGHPTRRAPDGAGTCFIGSHLPEAGAQQVDHRQAPVDELADRGLGADPAGRRPGHVQAVVDQQAVGDRLARGLHELHGVEVGEPAVEAGGDVLPPVGLDRATGQQGAQPRGLGQRRRQPLRVAPGDDPRRRRRRRDGAP